MHARVKSVAALTLLGGATLFAVQSPSSAPQVPTFKTGVEYVEVDAVVTDPQGNVVADLTKDDFEIFEDGVRQLVTTFSAVDVPLDLEPDTPSGIQTEPDVQSNERPFDGSDCSTK